MVLLLAVLVHFDKLLAKSKIVSAVLGKGAVNDICGLQTRAPRWQQIENLVDGASR